MDPPLYCFPRCLHYSDRMAADLQDRVVPAAALRVRQPTRRSKLRDYGKPDAGQYELPADHSTLVVGPQLLRTDGAAQ